MRLIDADKILDNLSGMLKSMDDYDAVRKVVNNMPTAYDVDAVVNELWKASGVAQPVGWSRKKEVVELKTAIEIVKDGCSRRMK